MNSARKVKKQTINYLEYKLKVLKDVIWYSMKQKAETANNITRRNHRLRKYIEWFWDTDLTLVGKLLTN